MTQNRQPCLSMPASPCFSFFLSMFSFFANHSFLRRTISAIGVLAVVGCHGLLNVTDPTHIDDASIANVSGANGRRLDASDYFSSNFSGVVSDVAWISDEWIADFPATINASTDHDVLLDQRRGDALEALGGSDFHLGALDRAYVETSLAISAVRAYTPDSLRSDFLGQLYGIRGFVVLQMAEDLCPGFPLNDVVDNLPIYGGPLSTDSAMTVANALLDSAVKYAKDSTRFVTLARVAKGRALLDAGKFDDAAAMVAPVATESQYTSEYTTAVIPYRADFNQIGAALGNYEGTNGLPFVSANDPRIPLYYLRQGRTDPTDSLFLTLKGYQGGDRIVFASGIEARLIEAEVALHNNQSWKPILDSLRATIGLSALVDPGTSDGRLDLLYRERAFWLYMTGHRLADFHRLIKVYGRNAEAIFPTGSYKGGDGSRYGTSISIPFIAADQERYNPHITSGCSGP